MFLIIWLCFAAFMVVSANNVIPVQTYPIYQQNGFINPPTNQPINIQPYTPSVTTQNQLQQLNISPSSIKQALLNKLLTGSSAQMILNPNTQNYDMYSYNFLNNQTPRNFVNNNVLLPTEDWKDRTNDINDKISRDSKSRERLNRANNKKIKSKRSQNDAIEDSQKHTVKDINKTQKKSKRNRNIQNPKHISVLENGESKNKTTKNRSRKRKEQTTENPVDKNNEKSAKLRRRKKKPKTNNMKNDELENQFNDVTSKYKESIDLDITQDGRDNENRKTRNSKHEVNDVLKSYPNSPQEITNHFLTNLNQLNNPLMSNWFAHYENLYQSLLSQPIIVPESTPKRRRKHKKNKKRKNAQNRNSTVNTKSVNSNKFDKDFVSTDLYSNPIVESFKSFETSDRNMKYTSNEIFQDGYSINEFEDKYDPGYYEGYIDDYYPLFMDSAAYTANNKEIILKNLNEHKYYYVTDKVETTTPKLNQKHQKSSYDVSESAPNDFEIFKRTYEEVEKESIRNAYKQNFEKQFEEEIRFQSPPFLESPDFETRKIDKSEIQTTQAFDDKVGRYVGDKSFSAKTANFNGAKKNGIQPQTKDIETVYAKSKVVAYGTVYIPEEDTSTAGQWEDNLTGNIYQNGGTTYILAKSVDDEEEYK
ncbi:unnamed protein product [Arctia plantaginis]|uniref:Uncharacterized protein n=1 Tax=Arctia plantaginis TaxID=874455 RepID=A0A8S1A5K1_ARCPL|nr:unnamed protein product [Arctia plantaginis]